jgi:hypothetical protein
MSRAAAKLEIELSGFGNGWTNISADLAGGMGERVFWGLPGSSPRDRIAKTGELHFALKNDASNHTHLTGAYSPDHVNRLAGFAEGIRVRYSQVVGAETFVLHVGTLDSIIPDPDPLGGSMLVTCVSVDYMDDLARAPCSSVSVLQNVRDDQLFSSLVATMPRQPESIQVTNGPDTFVVALDKIDAKTRIYSVLQDVCMSSLSLCYVKGQTLVYEPRSARALSTTPVDLFDRNLIGLDAIRNRINRINSVQGTAHPRAVDAAPTTVLWSLAAGSSNAIQIPSHTPIIIWAPYTDPVSHQAIGGLNVQTPVAHTDFTFNGAADGSGADLTANIGIVVDAFGNTSKLTITNNGPDGYLTAARLLGKGIFDFTPVMLQADDANSQINVGINVLSFDAPYQSSVATENEICLYIVNLYKGASTQIPRVRFRCPATDLVLAARLLRRQISDRIALGESLTGVSSTRNFFINSVDIVADNRNHLTVEWSLAPADQTQYWLLEVAGRSELGQTTVLGFGLVIGHTDVAHVDIAHGDVAHADVAHADVSHVDTHSDVAHSDIAHGDAGVHGDTAHGDVAHVDSAHADVSHGDVAHSDISHSDVAHGDVAHTDSHSDVVHQDVAHGDSFFETHTDDGGDPNQWPNHTDAFGAHDDSHTDVAHGDTTNAVAHTDTAHSDSAHSDSHTDTAHTDVSHTDTAHTDTAHDDAGAHTDIVHSDVAHADVAHADVAHTDAAHTDTHTDTSHVDSAHGDIN